MGIIPLFLWKGVFNQMLVFFLRPWHLIVIFLASQLNHEQNRVIEYLLVENQVLREKLGKGRILEFRDRLRIKCCQEATFHLPLFRRTV